MGRNPDGIRTIEIIYDALPSQKRFHACTARFKGFSGPVGSGKSQALCQEAIRLSYQNPGRMGLLGAPTYSMLRDATQTALLDILAQNCIPFEHNKAENVLVMKDTGSRILLRSMDEFERLRGTNLAWFGLDELTYTSEEAWLRLEGRLRDPQATKFCGFAAWTPKGYDWVYRRFIDPLTKTQGYEAVIAPPGKIATFSKPTRASTTSCNKATTSGSMSRKSSVPILPWRVAASSGLSIATYTSPISN